MPVTAESVIYRPRFIRWIAGPLAAAIVILFTVISFGLHGSAGFSDKTASFQRGDQVAMIGLGILIGAGLLAFCRPRVIADADGIRVRNVVGGYDLPWTAIRAIRYDVTAWWPHLELQDDEEIALQALQAADKAYAVDGVRALRALHRAAVGDE